MPRNEHMTDAEKNPSGYLMQSHQLLKLIEQHPELPLLFQATEAAGGCVCSQIHAWIGEVLDCKQQINDEKIYTDRDELMDDLRDVVYDTDPYDDRPDSYYDKMAEQLAAEYEPFWRECIIITLQV